MEVYMTNAARGEFGHKIGNESLNFAITLKAGKMLEGISESGNDRDLDALTEILAEMTKGTSKPKTADQISELPITLVEFRTIIKGATQAANDAMPDDREVGNAPQNRKAKRAAQSKK